MRGEFTFNAILQSSAWILFAVASGGLIASIIESRNWTSFVSFVAKPLLSFSRLPALCGLSFCAAFFSNNAAGSMLASAYANGKITRKEMFLAAIANSFAAKLRHMMRPAVIIIPLLGLSAILYLLIQFALEFIQVIFVLSFGRSEKKEPVAVAESTKEPPPSWNKSLRYALRSTGKILLRVLLITLPIYIFVSYLGDKGAFQKAEKCIPAKLRGVLSPEMIAIMGTKLGGLVSSASVAEKFYRQGKVSTLEILIALMAANIITIPFSALRRNLPTALGVFPRRDGLWIVAITQGLRFVFNFGALALLIVCELNL